MNAEDWKAGFQAALTQYFYSQKFSVFDENYYGNGTDYEASIELWNHVGIRGRWNEPKEYGIGANHYTVPGLEPEFCEVDLEHSDTVADMTEYDHTYFTDTEAPSAHKVYLLANLTCKCRKYTNLKVCLEDSLSNAIRAVAMS